MKNFIFISLLLIIGVIKAEVVKDNEESNK